jgi:exosortase
MARNLIENIGAEFPDCWRRLPNKGFFFLLLAAWLALFQFLGNSTFGYIDTPSLMRWMLNAYNSAGSEDGHGVLIPFVVLALFWWKRKELLAQRLEVWPPGLALLALALVLHVLGYLMQQPRISIVALFTGIYGLMGLAWGPRWLRASFFPFFLFVFCLPLGSLTEPLTFRLRLLVSKTVAILCQHVLAINVVSEGTNLINVPGQYSYEVAAACSGIRSLIATTAIAVIYAFVAFSKHWKRGVLILSAIPLAVVGNVFRMMTIVIAAEFGGQQAGAYVHEGGPLGVLSLLPYVPAFLGLLLIGRWLEKRTPGAVGPAEAPASSARTL